MLTKLVPSPDLTSAFQGDSPVLLVDAEGNTTHVVLPVEEARRLLDENYRRELDVAFKQADAGKLEPCDIESTLAKAHCQFKERASQSLAGESTRDHESEHDGRAPGGVADVR